MKTFKKADIILSTGLILLFLILTVIRQDAVFVIGYFVVGGWQLISMFVHAATKYFTSKNTSRYIYHRIVASIFCLSALGIAVPGLLMIMLTIMLFAAPVMAICYTIMCCREYSFMKKRELVSLR